MLEELAFQNDMELGDLGPISFQLHHHEKGGDSIRRSYPKPNGLAASFHSKSYYCGSGNLSGAYIIIEVGRLMTSSGRAWPDHRTKEYHGVLSCVS
jgi:hypothetical protein